MKIAIQGHPTRGKEVIQILESLGGKNIHGLNGNGKDYEHYYHIDSRSIITLSSKYDLHNCKFYTLEEFEKVYPFKIGDRVISLTTGSIGTITKFSENGIYYFKYDNGISTLALASYLKLYKEMKEERNVTLTLDKAKEWYKKGGELREIALQAFSEKELISLPKSWEEFCKQGNPIASWRYNMPIKYQALFKLEQLRDCWWNGWEPEWDASHKYAIKNSKNALCIICACNISAFLVFPTMKMAKEFLECFRDLIEKAKGLI